MPKFLRLKSHVKHTLVFENEDLREKAKSCVPLMLLKEKSTKIFNSKSNLDKDGQFHICSDMIFYGYSMFTTLCVIII